MKKIILTAVCMLAAVAAYGQGQINFNNRVLASGIDAPVMDASGGLLGSGFMAQLYASAAGANSFAAVGDPLPFRDGTGAGYFNTSAPNTSLRSIASIAPGSPADLKVVAWDAAAGSTYEAAVAAAGAAGESTILAGIVTGGAGAPPSLPANLTGLTSFNLSAGGVIPEPSTIALGLLGAGLLVFRRRK